MCLEGHPASVNVVRWFGGVLYAAPSGQTERIWDPNGARLVQVVLVAPSPHTIRFPIPRFHSCRLVDH
jgi:hypothetical protein